MEKSVFFTFFSKIRWLKMRVFSILTFLTWVGILGFFYLDDIRIFVASLSSEPQIVLTHTPRELRGRHWWKENYYIPQWKLYFSPLLWCTDSEMSPRFQHKTTESNFLISGNSVAKYIEKDGKKIFAWLAIKYFPNKEHKTIEEFKKEGYEEGGGLYENLRNRNDLITLTKPWERWTYIFKEGEFPYYFSDDGQPGGDGCYVLLEYEEIRVFTDKAY